MDNFDYLGLLIVGPCAAESEEQINNTFSQLYTESKTIGFNINYFRAGVWKPRSSPDRFEGVGKTALTWLQGIQNRYKIPVCVEIATSEHIDECLSAGINNFWIGSRTTVNPFIVEKLAQYCNNLPVTVMIKNPVNADFALWKGAIERFIKYNVKKIMAIHRGFFDNNEKQLRNAPCWDIPIRLKVEFPDMPVICDVSHISGNTKYIRTIAQTAINLGFDGLMAEVHCCPREALSDSSQQLTPEQLSSLIESLQLKEKKTSSYEDNLFKHRELIAEIDNQIASLFEKRANIVREISQIKKTNKLSVVDAKQFNLVKKRYLNNVTDVDYILFIEKFLDILHNYSIQIQYK